MSQEKKLNVEDDEFIFCLNALGRLIYLIDKEEYTKEDLHLRGMLSECAALLSSYSPHIAKTFYPMIYEIHKLTEMYLEYNNGSSEKDLSLLKKYDENISIRVKRLYRLLSGRKKIVEDEGLNSSEYYQKQIDSLSEEKDKLKQEIEKSRGRLEFLTNEQKKY